MQGVEARLEAALGRTLRLRPAEATGVVLDVVGLSLEVGGLRAPVGACLEVEAADGVLEAEVIGFRSGRLLTTPLGPLDGVRPGARAVLSDRGMSVPVGDALLGRVLDAFGRPLDGGPDLGTLATQPVRGPAPAPFERRPIAEPLVTGVRAFDAFLTLGVGQRIGIFAGAGVGKSTLLGMICRSSSADVNVVGLVGERGRELNEFVRNSLGEDGMSRSVVVTATSDQPPLVRARGAEAATAIAEHFRDRGRRVLLVMDSVTRYAMALREAALAAGEPPATKGYPPSVFAALPRLLERAGNHAGTGSITALYTVFVEGDDLSDPIADAVRGILDGHVVLSRRLADQGHFPAIDVLASVSRLFHEITDERHRRAASELRGLLAAYAEALDLIQVGAYVAGSDPRVDAARALMPQLEALLRQAIGESTPLADTLTVLGHLAAAAPRAR
ncbi:MAG: FliI/YscN family ATPase [Polyangiaceae bacterium]|nr:FliI/YscN family ATPase [Polyangiaceae bacterium]